MKKTQKHIILSLIFLVSLLPIILFFFMPVQKTSLNPLIYQTIVNSMANEINSSPGSTQFKNRPDLQKYFKFLRLNTKSFVLSDSVYSFSVGNDNNFKNCTYYTSENNQFSVKSSKWYCFKSKNLKLYIKPQINGRGSLTIFNIVFMVFPPIFVAIFFIILWNTERKISLLSNFLRDSTLGKLPVIDNNKIKGDMKKLYNSLAVMTATLKENEKTLKNRLEIISSQSVEIQKSQEEIISREKLSTIGYLTTGLAHELGNPVAALISIIEFMKENPHIEMEENLKIMDLELHRMDGLIRKLLDFSRPVNEQIINIDIHNMVKKAIDILKNHHDIKNIEFIDNIPDDFPKIKANENLIQVFINLFINSGQSEGTDKIKIFSKIHDNYAKIYVEDNGKGIDTKIQSSIFEPFMTTKNPGQGTGLGLSISRILIEQMNGKLNLEENMEGCTFSITLDIASLDN